MSESESASQSVSTTESVSSSESLSTSVSESSSNSSSISESEKPQGEVIITYIRENDGKEIRVPRQDTPKLDYNTPYDTTENDELPKYIEFEGKKYERVPSGGYPVGKVDSEGHLESSDPIKGKVEKPLSKITYVYKEVKEEPSTPTGNVYVHYVDTDGKVIEGDKNVTYVYKLVKTPTPVEPTPEQPSKPTTSPKQLPNTGTADSVATSLMGAITGLASLATLSRRKKDEN